MGSIRSKSSCISYRVRASYRLANRSDDDRLTLWNAGNSPEELSIEQVFEVHESIPRNPLIADVCYKAGYIDSWGSRC